MIQQQLTPGTNHDAPQPAAAPQSPAMPTASFFARVQRLFRTEEALAQRTDPSRELHLDLDELFEYHNPMLAIVGYPAPPTRK